MNQSLRLRPDGFRERGGEVTRMEAFVDAAFAFALTMLVISVGTIPDTVPKLIDAMKGIPAFAGSFALIAAFWYQHVTWSRRFGLDDGGSVLLSLLLVFLVMVFIYPLKAMAAMLFGWLSGGWLPYGFSGGMTLVGLQTMFVLFAIVYGSMAIVISLLYLRAWRQREVLELSIDEKVETIVRIGDGCKSVVVAMLSIAVALALPVNPPNWLVGSPGMVYALMGFSGLVQSAIARRARKRLLAASNP
ncbi:MAG: TMEM175 family protein [Lysobacteraceae bacterium]